ncbi:MAG: heavy-metal-associated domain-containing protein [Desulfobacterales bacterium]|nr:heavy-metal-associated domain-containing protein [Desulfobacterales bacterium]
MKKISVLILTGLFFLLGVGGSVAQDQDKESGEVQRAIFQVENLTCSACFSKINAGLSPMEGFDGMGANMFRKMVAVDFKSPLTPEKIKQAISGLGYPATLDSVESLKKEETFAYMQDRRNPFKGRGCCAGQVSVSKGCPGQGSCSTTPSKTSKDI